MPLKAYGGFTRLHTVIQGLRLYFFLMLTSRDLRSSTAFSAHISWARTEPSDCTQLGNDAQQCTRKEEERMGIGGH